MIGLGGGNVDEIERGRAVGQCGQELPPQIAVDLGDGDQHRQAQTERHHHRWRQRAGTIDIGDRQPQHGETRARQAARQRHQCGGDAAQQREHQDGRSDERRRHALVVSKPDRDADQSQDHHRHQGEITPARAMPFAAHRLAKQRGYRHVMDAAERP